MTDILTDEAIASKIKLTLTAPERTDSIEFLTQDKGTLTRPRLPRIRLDLVTELIEDDDLRNLKMH
jgi:hypothetical protein